MSDSPQQITRREILKRGAVVGGTVLWLTPVVQTLGMGRAFAQTPSDVCIEGWSDQVVGSHQGTTKDGGSVGTRRSEPQNALGAPNAPALPGTNPYFSLGYGGWLILRLSVPYYSGKLGEALVVETSSPGENLETALVEVSANGGGPWFEVGTATNNPTTTSFSLDDVIPPIPAMIRYVRVTDTTDAALHNDASDAFDVNAVGITCPEPAVN